MKRVFAAFYIVLATTILIASPAAARSDSPVLYKDPSCGCCGAYAQHLKRVGLPVVIKNVDDVDAVKDSYGIPDELRSCHTMIVGGYVVEGHVPLAVLGRLLTEKPEIKGISLPGMPSASPGMPGPKSEPFVVYVIGDGGSAEVFAVE